MSADGSTYYGVMIHRETSWNSAGLRWWAFGTNGRLRADTLAGIRELIRHDRTTS